MSESPASGSWVSMSELKRVRITGDANGTHVIDVETGRELHTISVDWHSEVDSVAVATVKVLFAEIDVETGAEIITVCPACGEAGGIEELLWLRDENRKLRDQVARLARDRAS